MSKKITVLPDFLYSPFVFNNKLSPLQKKNFAKISCAL